METQPNPNAKPVGYFCGWVPGNLIDTSGKFRADKEYKGGYRKQWYTHPATPRNETFGRQLFSSDSEQDSPPYLPSPEFAPPFDFTVQDTYDKLFTVTSTRFDHHVSEHVRWIRNNLPVIVLRPADFKASTWLCCIVGAATNANTKAIKISIQSLQHHSDSWANPLAQLGDMASANTISSSLIGLTLTPMSVASLDANFVFLLNLPQVAPHAL